MSGRDSGGRAATAAVLAAVMLLAGCATGSSGREHPGTEPFVVARTAAVGTLDPARAVTPSDQQLLGLVYDTLLETGAKGRLAQGLATSWQVSDGGTTVTFTLRRGVTFHNGAAFTAADAKASIERMLDILGGGKETQQHAHPTVPSMESIESIESVAAPDAHTLVLRLTKPDRALLTALASPRASILDSADLKAGKVARQPNGTGPFRWISRQQARQSGQGRGEGQEQGQRGSVTLAANVDYWNGAPKLSRVRIRMLADQDADAVVSATQAGEADLGLVSDPRAVRGAIAGQTRVMEQFTLSFHALVLNGRAGPHNLLGKRRVRQALACAIDRQQIVETGFLGHGAVTGPIISPAYHGGPAEGLPCESPGSREARQRAVSLLAEAGYPRGFPLQTAVTSGHPAATEVVTSLQNQLERVGVDLRPAQPSNTNTARPLAGGADAALVWRGASYDPYRTYAPYITPGYGSTRPSAVHGGVMGSLLRQANSTSDMQQRRQLFHRLGREMLGRSPWVWLVRNPAFYVLGDRVRGFQPTPSGSLEHLRGTWVAEPSPE